MVMAAGSFGITLVLSLHGGPCAVKAIAAAVASIRLIIGLDRNLRSISMTGETSAKESRPALSRMLRSLRLLLTVGAVTLAASAGAQASILQFTLADGTDTNIQSDTVSDAAGDLLHDYGSAAGAAVSSFNTPNVAVEWGLTLTPPDNRWANLGFAGTGGGMAFYIPANNVTTAPTSAITFTAAGGYEVLVNAISAKNFDGATQSVTFRVNVDGTDTDFTQAVNSNGTLVFDLSSAGSGSVVTLLVQAAPPTLGAWGFDDLTFSQVAVPEPASLALLGIGGMTLLARRRNQS
jgi:hypothetical protein